MRIAERRECDVLVCGGGTAGLGAAVAAARLGAKTILLERHGFCGGICVSSLVHTFDGARNCRNHEQFVIGGVPREVIRRLDAINGLALADNPPETLNFDPEAMKQVSDELLQAAGVTLLYHLFAVEVIRDGERVQSIIAAGKEGLWELRAKVVIDTTGDGDVSYFADAEYEKDGQMQTMSQHFRIGGLAGNRGWEVLEHECRAAMDAAYKAGRAPKYGGPWFIRIRAGEITANCTRLYGDGTKTEDLTRAEIMGREDMRSILEIFRASVPDFRQSYVLASGTEIGRARDAAHSGRLPDHGGRCAEWRRHPGPDCVGELAD